MRAYRKCRFFVPVLLCLTLLTACQSAVSPPYAPDASGSGASVSPENPPTQPGFVPAPEPAPELVPGPEPGPAPEPVPAPEPEPIPEPVPEPAPAPDPKPSDNKTLYVLMYHSFVPEGVNCNTWTLTEPRLREDLQWLSDNGYTTVLPSELAAGKPLPEKAVMLTFDDGYANNYTIAYPLLQQFQAKAVISLIVQYQDSEDPNCLSWEMCREMVQSGLVEIGSHTYACHNDTPRGIQRAKGETRAEYEARVFTDLQTSIDLIEENVGVTVQFFAYPHGQTESWASSFVKEHFQLTVTTHSGSTNISKGLYNMNRFNVSMEVPLSSILPAD